MPFIHIKSLPPQTSLNTVEAVEQISRDFAQETGIAIEHITTTWEFISSGHYAVAGKTTTYQPQTSHPILIDLLAPDFHDAANIERMLHCLANSVATHAHLATDNIFINYRQAHSGQVFDKGHVVHWEKNLADEQ